ncbi:B12-binding domain-containing protein [Mycobacterium sp. URHB0021]|jgi:MerR family transcriptional regulator, light-induced transcriptional regulator
MQDVADTRNALQHYEEALAEGDRSKIVRLVEGLLAGGMTPLDVLTRVVASAQRNVGQKWQRG